MNKNTISPKIKNNKTSKSLKQVRHQSKKTVLKDVPKVPFPKFIPPMLATLVKDVPNEEDWIYEVKWDGYRALAFCNRDNVNILSRNNKSFNLKYYPLYQELQKHKLEAILDGEIVVLNEKGIASFGSLQNWRSEADGQLMYYVFDILWLNGYDLTNLPLSRRRELLKSTLPKAEMIRESENVNVSPAKFLDAAKKIGLEGIIAKRNDSIYLPGERSRSWLKLKAQLSHEVVIGGYTVNEGSPKPFSALVVGVYENTVLQYIGKVGTGFTDKLQAELMAKFKPLIINKCPFTTAPDVNKPSRFRPKPPHAEVVWLSPKLVCEVKYTEMTADGNMRHPSFKGMREDKNAIDVHTEALIKNQKKPTKKVPIKLQPLKKNGRKTLLNPSEKTQVKIINGHELKFGNLNKIFWPEENITKCDLLNYYYQVAPYILPYLKDRPQSLNRFPNGIYGLSFYQKDVTATAPKWIKKFPYRTSLGEDKNFLVVQDEADLLWMANLGAIEMNPWNSKIQSPDNPDWCIIDIDPTEKNTFEQVIQTAQITKEVLDILKIEGYCKTSGSTGLHIYIPMGAKYTYDQCQFFARLIASQVHLQLPIFTSIERLNKNREGKVYIDFLQNRPKATLAAPYSVRPKLGATVSMPLHWEEVKKGLHQKQFTIKNALHRLKSEGDLFKPVIGKGINLDKAQKILKAL